ncbi:HAD domain-containing protein, partial [Hydrogenophaga sp. OTU3427]|uniref:HAD domain-containing protein n=1 Tax=Hydrogenophaga sp. OTU3427 TaxID=3043856 RepID=UPI00313B87EE
MILFLDFDGVLHPEFSHESRHFCCLPVLEQVVRQLQDCEVVISSTWRLDFPLDRLREKFSSDLAARVVGATP